MLHPKDLHFLQEKIYDLQYALFASKSDAVLKMPTSIVSVIKVDDVAQLWFFIPRPKQYINEFEKEFFTRLDFFRKGKNYFLKIDGKAFIVNDPEEINSLMDLPEYVKSTAMNEAILVKVRILNVDYYESRSALTLHWYSRVQEQVNKWLFNQQPGYRPYKVQPDTFAY